MVSKNDADTLLDIDDVSFVFGGRQVLKNVSLSLLRGELVALIGPNGGGKSTLLKIAARILHPTSGVVRLHKGVKIGYSPQNVNINHIIPITVKEFLVIALSKDCKGRLSEIVERVGVQHLLHLPISALSGGEMQTVLFARCLLQDPDILILDEPTSAMDVGAKAKFNELVGEVCKSGAGKGVIMASHDLHVVMGGADSVVCLNASIHCRGEPCDVHNKPEFKDLFPQEKGGAAIYVHHNDPNQSCSK